MDCSVVGQIADLVHVAQPCNCRIYTIEAPSRLILLVTLIDLKVYRLLINQLSGDSEDSHPYITVGSLRYSTPSYVL